VSSSAPQKLKNERRASSRGLWFIGEEKNKMMLEKESYNFGWSIRDRYKFGWFIRNLLLKYCCK
jgi:hypothetical protein